ncbi:MAG TPA: hypothetical protein VFZ93_04580 [Albitalea sp.]
MPPRFLPCLAAALAVAAATPALSQSRPQPHDYPTADRVVYVQSCMRDHPGPHYEMLNKCSCVLDTIAKQVPFDDFVSMTTATNANTIGGERGSYIRDVEPLQQQIRRFRQLQSQALKSCMVATDSASR